MPRELPPTSSLRAFSRSARTLSFKRAAAELHVSPSALSRQIQALEAHLGVRLFDRTNPGLALTDEGRRYLEAVDAALARLEGAQNLFAPQPRTLRVSALESFSESWLVPNLPDFERAHPDVEIELEATLRYADFTRDRVDVAIRFGRGPWEGLHGEPIVDLDFFPVCSPGLATGDPPLRRPPDLARHTLIHVAQTPDAWAAWLRAAGVPGLAPRREVTYDHVSIALSAAESGQGVALSTPILCAQRLRARRLRRPFRVAVRSEATYHFVCRPESLEDPRVTALRDWLVERLSRASPGLRSAIGCDLRSASPRCAPDGLPLAARRTACPSLRVGRRASASLRLQGAQARMRDARLRGRRGGAPVAAMEQLTCIAPNQLEWRDVPAPRIQGDGEALVRPLAVARCDIDRVLCSGLFALRSPFALGHECVGEVTALGDGVRGLALGQRVVVAFQVSCGRCTRCAAGHTALCEKMPTLSDYGMQPLSGVEYGGMLSDAIRVPYAEAMLRPIPPAQDPVALASVSDNAPDGYRAVAPHLAARPGSEVLIASHGLPSIPLYAAQAALALGASRVDFASGDAEQLALAERLGAHPVETDFGRPARVYPIVVDAGVSPRGLEFAIRATEPEGICQSVNFHPGPGVPLPMSRMYTLGIRFHVGRCHSAALLPELLALIAAGRLRPEAVTTRVVDWSAAAEAWPEPAIKLVVRR